MRNRGVSMETKYVYLLRTNTSHYKIGIANNYKARIATLQTNSPTLIKLVCARLCLRAVELESILHKKFKDSRSDGGTEWFSLTEAQALETVMVINSAADVDYENRLVSSAELLKEAKSSLKKIERKVDATLKLNKHYRKQVVRQNKVAEPKVKEDTDDALLAEAKNLIIEENKASASLLQRHLRVGYARAARLIDDLQRNGFVSKQDGAKPRKVLV